MFEYENKSLNSLISSYFLLFSFWLNLFVFRTKVKQNFYEPGLANDFLLNNNIPNGVWDDAEASALYPDLQELEDYPAYQPPCQ